MLNLKMVKNSLLMALTLGVLMTATMAPAALAGDKHKGKKVVVVNNYYDDDDDYYDRDNRNPKNKYTLFHEENTIMQHPKYKARVYARAFLRKSFFFDTKWNGIVRNCIVLGLIPQANNQIPERGIPGWSEDQSHFARFFETDRTELLCSLQSGFHLISFRNEAKLPDRSIWNILEHFGIGWFGAVLRHAGG